MFLQIGIALLLYLALQDEIKQTGRIIMTKISEFGTKMQDFNDRQDKAVADLQGDVKKLNDDIKKLQDSEGDISEEDQATLDALTERGQAITDKIEALDALTPPAAPQEPSV